MTAEGIIIGNDDRHTCSWHGGLDDYRRYHDEEWGRPVTDDVRLFEKICLEGFQSGLSWLTILRKRENFRQAFAGFDFAVVAEFDETDIARCLADAGIIRHRGKIVSTINNAKRALALKEEFGSLARYFWSFEPGRGERPDLVTRAVIVANPTTPTSVRLSKDLKKRGWTFVGPTTIYAFMQAMGMVNDHLEGCYCRAEVEAMREVLERP
ncbi:DNA-3-methyladenine glycosylase I [Rhizobium sp. LjRoot30]|uniref:DNA-3-methyladenine glycosylase I n=1 Tax=Rhizobium sp. LjRoot30 TaxID=3342320 RepID=UPI003ED01AF8